MIELKDTKPPEIWLEYQGDRFLVAYTLPETITGKETIDFLTIVKAWEGVTMEGKPAKLNKENAARFLSCKDGMERWAFILGHALNARIFFDFDATIKNLSAPRNGATPTAAPTGKNAQSATVS